MSKTTDFKNKLKELSKFTASELAAALREKDEVLALKVWTTEDIESQAEELDYSASDAKRIAANVKGMSIISDVLEDCSADWDRVNDAIFDTASELGIKSESDPE
jgi:hypothetical protein